MDINDIEQRHDRLQWMIFVGVAVGSSAFAGQELIDMLGGNESLHFVLTMLGGIGWVLACGALYATSSLVKQEAIKRILEDERMASNRSSAFEFGFAAIMITQFLLMITSAGMAKYTGIEMTVGFATNFSLAIALIASLGRFVYLNR